MQRELKNSTGMFPETKSWNPFVGCNYKCTYCGPSFQLQLKRRGKHDKICGRKCYDYVPHAHEERLKKLPSSGRIFVVADGDISLAPLNYTRRIIKRIREHNVKFPNKTYILQSKNPRYFKNFLKELPSNVLLQTTLETNRDNGYSKWSKAPKPSVRYKDFLDLKYRDKVVTVEPIMDFDSDVLKDWIVKIRPKYVWLGFNSKPNSHVFKKTKFPEPSREKTQELINALESAGILVHLHNDRARTIMKGIEVKKKELKGVKTHMRKRKTGLKGTKREHSPR